MHRVIILEASCSDSAILIGDCDEAGMGGCEVYRMMAFDGVESLDFKALGAMRKV